MFLSKSSFSLIAFSCFALLFAGCEDDDRQFSSRCDEELERVQGDSALPFPGQGTVLDLLTPQLGTRSFQMQKAFQPSANSPVVAPDAQSFDLEIRVSYDGGSLRWNKPVLISQEPETQGSVLGYCGPTRLQADVNVAISSNNGAFQEQLPGTLFVATDSQIGLATELQVTIPSEGLAGAFRVSPGASENQWNHKDLRLNATWSRHGTQSGWIDVRWSQIEVDAEGRRSSLTALSERLYTSAPVVVKVP